MSIKQRLHVVVGIIQQGEKICIARRKHDVHLGGLWEFPGGKVEPNETAFMALQRELLEEIGIEVQAATPFMQLPFDYPERAVLLDIWLITEFTGEAHGREGQPVEWVRRQQLTDYAFPLANQPIMARLLQGEL